MRLALLITLTIALPVNAETYLGFAPESTKQNMVIQSDHMPVAGKDYPQGWTIKQWTREADADPNNYKLENGTVVHDPPFVLVAAPDETMQEINACLNSKADKLTDEQFVKVLRLSKISDKSTRDSEWSKVRDSLPE